MSRFIPEPKAVTPIDPVVIEVRQVVGQIRTLTETAKNIKSDVDLSAIVLALGAVATALQKIAEAVVANQTKIDPAKSITITSNKNNITYTAEIKR